MTVDQEPAPPRPPLPSSADHEVITPPPVGRFALEDGQPLFDPSALERAEAALKALSGQFDVWLAEEVAKLKAAFESLPPGDIGLEGARQLYIPAHNLKGLAGTYDLAAVTRLARSLCRLLDACSPSAPVPRALAFRHVEAIAEVSVRARIEQSDPALLERLAALESEVALRAEATDAEFE